MIAKQDRKTSRAQLLLDDANSRTQDILDRVPKGRKRYRQQADHVAETCRLLVSSRPSRQPTAAAIAAEGAAKFGGFPAEQTLYNDYRELLQIWRDVHEKLVIPSRNVDLAPITEEELDAADAGTRTKVRLLEEALRRTLSENSRLKQFIKENTEVHLDGEVGRSKSHSAAYESELGQWLKRIENRGGVFDVDGVGVKAGSLCRPGTLIFPREVLEALKSLINNEPEETDFRD